MKKGIFIIGLLIAASYETYALNRDDLKALAAAVETMCATPTKQGEILKVEGDAKVGAPVLFRVVGANLEGKLNLEKWNGISATLDKYATDPRQCAIATLKLLLPAFQGDKQSELLYYTDQLVKLSFSPDVRGFSEAISRNHVRAVQLFICSKLFDPNGMFTLPPNHYRPLWLAAEKNAESVTRMLLELGATPQFVIFPPDNTMTYKDMIMSNDPKLREKYKEIRKVVEQFERHPSKATCPFQS